MFTIAVGLVDLKSLREDMDRHGITSAIGEKFIFTTLHEALSAVHEVRMDIREVNDQTVS